MSDDRILPSRPKEWDQLGITDEIEVTEDKGGTLAIALKGATAIEMFGRPISLSPEEIVHFDTSVLVAIACNIEGSGLRPAREPSISKD